ncbi:TPA: SLATT domain-containing protein [Escherichia coli]|nr:SLATT domain-containing protein [Escherichia coli]
MLTARFLYYRIAMMDKISNLFKWIFSLNPVEAVVNDPTQKLLNSMRVTSKCRYNASIRLKRQSQLSFFSTTVLSLGLILIPLLQNADIHLHLPLKVLNMLQIFLAVSVLVYSVIIGTAHYEIRSKQLNECGDKIKDLIRKLRLGNNKEELSTYIQMYDSVSTESENHARVDFLLASLEMKTDYKYTGLLRFWLYIRSIFLYIFPWLIPLTLVLSEIIFICDMVGVTYISTPFLTGE